VVKFLIVLMHHELSVSILRWSFVFSCPKATAMAGSSSLLIVCLSFVI
jgi:hypothetical protein